MNDDALAGLMGGAAALFSGIFLLVMLAIFAVMVAAMWMLFTKAGQPGWAAIVPIYNGIILLQIVGKPIWWILLMFIPFVNFIIVIMVYIDLAKSFGQSPAFAIGLLLLPFIFFSILGFGNARYLGPLGAPSGPAPLPIQ
jgi:hypothetical protein